MHRRGGSVCSGFAGGGAHAAAAVTRSKLSMNRFTGVVPAGISLLTNLQALYAFAAAALARSPDRPSAPPQLRCFVFGPET